MTAKSTLQEDEQAAATEIGYVFTFLLGLMLTHLLQREKLALQNLLSYEYKVYF